MCNIPTIEAEEVTPAHVLSRLMGDNMGVDIRPELLRLFIKFHWSKIAALAHKIHEQD